MRGGGKVITLKVSPCTKMLRKLEEMGALDDLDGVPVENMQLFPLPHMCLVDVSSMNDVMNFPGDSKVIFGFNSFEDGTVSKLQAHGHSADLMSKLTDNDGSEEGGLQAMKRMNTSGYQAHIFNNNICIPGVTNPLGRLLNGHEASVAAARGAANNPRRFLFGANGAPGGMWSKIPKPSKVKDALGKIVGEGSAVAALPEDFPTGNFPPDKGVVKGAAGWQHTTEGPDHTRFQKNGKTPKDPSDLTAGEVCIYGGVLIKCTEDEASKKSFEMLGETDFFIPGDGIFSYVSDNGLVKCPNPEVKMIPVNILGNPEILVRVTMSHCDGSQKHPYVHKNADGSDTYTDEDYYKHKQHMSVFFTTKVNTYTWDDMCFKTATNL
jgi:hypothetical protein